MSVKYSDQTKRAGRHQSGVESQYKSVVGLLAAVTPGATGCSTNQNCSCHIYRTHADFSSLPAQPLMWSCQPGDKWAQTWKTLSLAKNNMLSTDLLSRNANTKCSICGNCTHFNMGSGDDGFSLYYPNVSFRRITYTSCLASNSCRTEADSLFKDVQASVWDSLVVFVAIQLT